MSRIYHAITIDILLSTQSNLIKFLIESTFCYGKCWCIILYNTVPLKSAVRSVILLLDQPLYKHPGIRN